MKIYPSDILIKDYTYHLPFRKIADFPLERRDQSKLLVYKNGVIEDSAFYHLPSILSENSTVILNNTKVIEARILFTKSTGGVIQIFCLEPHLQSIEQSLQQREKVFWKCMIGGASKWKQGQILSKDISLNSGNVHVIAKYIGKEDDSFIIEFNWNSQDSFAEILHAAGAIPLPPYIKREAEKIDADRYQTVFARSEGSVAAPTAALHFTVEIFEKLKEKNITVDYITLHVGAGTFKPVKSETIAGHDMHSEAFTVSRFTIQTIINATKIVAVGTTTLRTLESLYWLGVKLINNLIEDEWNLQQWEPYELDNSVNYRQSLQAILHWMEENNLKELHCRTSLIIVPGYDFKICKGLITNFHQPQSTLLLLVAAFVGDNWKKIYQYALDNNYRFLSYGDGSYLER